MKKVLILLGSPRKEGNTATLCRFLTEDLNGSDFTIETRFLYEKEIRPCLDCRYCKKDALRCKVDDDMEEIYTKMDSANVIVFATPIYWFGPSAKTKLVLDRMRPYYGNKLLKNKLGALLLAAGEGKNDCDLTIEMFKRSFAALEMDYTGVAISKSYDIGEAAKDKEAIEMIDLLSGKIGSIS